MVEDRIAALEERVARLEDGTPADAPSGARASGAPPTRGAAARSGPARRAMRGRRGAGRPGAARRGRHGRLGARRPARSGAHADSAAGEHGAPASSLPPGWAGGAAAMSGRVAPPPFVAARPAPAARSQRPTRDLEDFVGGSLLAWLGGIAVLAGLAFLLTIAVSRGWIGEGARTALAGVLSAGLLGAGVWLRERKGQTEASLAAAAVGDRRACSARWSSPGPVYHLVPVPLAFAGAFATGAVATALAIHWRAQVMGWLGLLGALWAPTALGAFDGGGMVFLAIAFAATIGVLVYQRWTTLGVVRVRLHDAAVARVGRSSTPPRPRR